jgi:hypothetical protein
MLVKAMKINKLIIGLHAVLNNLISFAPLEKT